MSELVPHKKIIDRPGKRLEYRSRLELLDFDKGFRPVKVSLADGKEGHGTCLGCHDTPCMVFGMGDTVVPEALADFPGDPGREVCPTSSIEWNATSHTILVNADRCIGCGLCAVRCPYGAISLMDTGKATVATGDQDRMTVARADPGTFAEHDRPKRKGQLGSIPNPALNQTPEYVGRLNDLQSSEFVRNLLIECGVKCRIRRRGDTNIRMDGILGFADGHLGVLEIELGNSVLDSPRALLEDIAVLHGRYGIEVMRVYPVSVILTLPNARSEYYQVVADISKVLDIRCRTVTVGSLLAVLWSFRTINGFPSDLFMTSPGKTNLWPEIKRLICSEIPEVEPYNGAYRPFK